jgi:hypothetical protein
MVSYLAGTELLHADKRADLTKLIVSFFIFANEPDEHFEFPFKISSNFCVDVKARNKILILIAQLISVCLPSEMVFCKHVIFSSFLFYFFAFFARSI